MWQCSSACSTIGKTCDAHNQSSELVAGKDVQNTHFDYIPHTVIRSSGGLTEHSSLLAIPHPFLQRDPYFARNTSLLFHALQSLLSMQAMAPLRNRHVNKAQQEGLQ